MSKLISRDTPLAELNIRRYEKPNNLESRELVRKLCLSIGLLQPGDSRDVVVDVLYVMLTNKEELSSEDIRRKVIEFRESRKLPLQGVASSNIRRQLKRLRDIHLLEKVANSYRINENARLSEIFEEKIEQFMLPSIMSRVKEYFYAVEEHFDEKNNVGQTKNQIKNLRPVVNSVNNGNLKNS